MVKAVQVAWDDRDCGQKHKGKSLAAQKLPPPPPRAKGSKTTNGRLKCHMRPKEVCPWKGIPALALEGPHRAELTGENKAPGGCEHSVCFCAEGTCPGFWASGGLLMTAFPPRNRLGKQNAV